MGSRRRRAISSAAIAPSPSRGPSDACRETSLRLAVILVHYHPPALAAAAVEALRRDTAGVDGGIEWLLIDNGSDEAGRALLDSLPVERIDPGENLGYAGGVNLGVARSTADII